MCLLESHNEQFTLCNSCCQHQNQDSCQLCSHPLEPVGCHMTCLSVTEALFSSLCEKIRRDTVCTMVE